MIKFKNKKNNDDKDLNKDLNNVIYISSNADTYGYCKPALVNLSFMISVIEKNALKNKEYYTDEIIHKGVCSYGASPNDYFIPCIIIKRTFNRQKYTLAAFKDVIRYKTFDIDPYGRITYETR